MPTDPSDDALREAATNRGLRLLKSRRRKPGVGDYGRFGLTDADGRKIFGFDDVGLTASAGDIAAYLRKGEQSTWAESARATKQTAKSKSVAAADTPSAKDPGPSPGRKAGRTGIAPVRRRERVRPPRPVEEERAKKAAPVRAEPVLTIRVASKADARILARLASQLDSDVGVADAASLIADSTRMKRDILVADRGGVIGFLAWQPLRTLQHGTVGRVTALVVEEGSRRSGVGRELLDTAIRAMQHGGCRGVEAISDIDIRNAHGFFRSTEFEQTSYRFFRTT
jgi:N-acetylglutamate synthase-like GNAT family acetyltransferase